VGVKSIQVGSRDVRARRAALVVAGTLMVLLALAGSTHAAPPSLFTSVSGTCVTSTGDSDFTTATITGNHASPLVRLSTQAGPGDLGPDFPVIGSVSFGGPDTIWIYDNPLNNGDTRNGTIGCASAIADVPYVVDFFDTPTTPTSFSGAVTPAAPLSDETNTVKFIAPAAAHYVADLSLTQGAVTLDDGTRQQTFASSGRFDLGVLAGDIYALSLTPQDGPQAKWSLSIHALPVVISNLAFDRQYERPTQITTASYTLDGDVSLTATILNSASQAVRSLASNAPILQGSHTLTWDGLNGSGSPVADGSYTLAISYTDAAGNSGAARASVEVDGTPPTATMVSPSRLPRMNGLVLEIADNLSGVKSASLSVDGTNVRTLAAGASQFTYVPAGGWRSGSHSFRVAAIDNAGNVASSGGSFTVPAPPDRVFAPDCVGKPRYKPRRITLTCADAGLWVSKIRWTRWTRKVATGVGVVHWNDCKPDCARGHFRSRRGAHLKLSRVARCRSRGFLEFTRLRLTPPKSARATLGGRSSATWTLSCKRR
jgi:FlgD Ig-like domain